MIRHLVMFRRKADVAPDPELEAALTAQMASLGERIPQVAGMVLRKNEISRPISWDYVSDASVADVEALNDYLQHPEHQAVVAAIKPYFEWAVVDYVF